jgi:hypothetical protein
MITYQKACLSALASAAMLLCAAQAQAQTYAVDQKFDLDGFSGNVFGSFTAIDANADTIFQASEMTFISLGFAGVVPGVGSLNLSFTPPNITVNPTTAWFPADRTLGDQYNGFFLNAVSTTGTHFTWTAGPNQFFDFGNTPGTTVSGDPQNSTFRFGSITFFDASGTPVALGQSDEWVTTAVPEPSTYLLMLGGIAALALKVRRRAA